MKTKLSEFSDSKFESIHRMVAHLLAIETDLLFSGRQAIANEVVIMLRAAKEKGQHVLTEHLEYQEGKANAKGV